jgi:hypothetical protein
MMNSFTKQLNGLGGSLTSTKTAALPKTPEEVENELCVECVVRMDLQDTLKTFPRILAFADVDLLKAMKDGVASMEDNQESADEDLLVSMKDCVAKLEANIDLLKAMKAGVAKLEVDLASCEGRITSLTAALENMREPTAPLVPEEKEREEKEREEKEIVVPTWGAPHPPGYLSFSQFHKDFGGKISFCTVYAVQLGMAHLDGVLSDKSIWELMCSTQIVPEAEERLRDPAEHSGVEDIAVPRHIKREIMMWVRGADLGIGSDLVKYLLNLAPNTSVVLTGFFYSCALSNANGSWWYIDTHSFDKIGMKYQLLSDPAKDIKGILDDHFDYSTNFWEGMIQVALYTNKN